MKTWAFILAMEMNLLPLHFGRMSIHAFAALGPMDKAPATVLPLSEWIRSGTTVGLL